jgi:hypothetical protein
MTKQAIKYRVAIKAHAGARDAFIHAQQEQAAGRKVQLGKEPGSAWTTMTYTAMQVVA